MAAIITFRDGSEWTVSNQYPTVVRYVKNQRGEGAAGFIDVETDMGDRLCVNVDVIASVQEIKE